MAEKKLTALQERALRRLQSMPYELQRDWEYVVEIDGLESALDNIGRIYIPDHFEGSEKVSLVLSGILIPDKKMATGLLLRSTSVVWMEIAQHLSKDWTKAYEIPYDKWEEIIAGAFHRAGYDEVTLTPGSGDFGRDVVAIKRGIGGIKILGSVKAYKPGHLVKHNDVRALLGVMSGERDTSKGILATTSDFAPMIPTDPFIQPFLPTRLELMNGTKLRGWLAELAKKR